MADRPCSSCAGTGQDPFGGTCARCAGTGTIRGLTPGHDAFAEGMPQRRRIPPALRGLAVAVALAAGGATWMVAGNGWLAAVVAGAVLFGVVLLLQVALNWWMVVVGVTASWIVDLTIWDGQGMVLLRDAGRAMLRVLFGTGLPGG